MSLKSREIEIVEKNPFQECQLDRKQYADILTQIVENYKDGFVLSINNKWGTGKTTFVKMWRQQLVLKGFDTIYFNAWENDHEDNALTALMGELKVLMNGNNEKEFKDVLNKAAILAKNILPGLLRAYVARKFDMKELEDLIENSTKGVTEMFEKDIEEYTARKRTVAEFRERLGEFIGSSVDKKPLVFFIDELDRCRPNYSVSVLEQIKHFFLIPGIVFVLSIDKQQLGHAVKGVYNSVLINSEDYLRRFIDIEYSLPEPNTAQSVDYLYKTLNFDLFFKSDFRLEHYDLGSDENEFLSISKSILKGLTLRQQQKIMTNTRLVLSSFNLNQYVYPVPFLFLIYLKNMHDEFYRELDSKSLSPIEVQNKIVDILKDFRIEGLYPNSIVALELYMLNLYYNFYYPEAFYREPFVTSDAGKKDIWIIPSKTGDFSKVKYILK